ncbi:DNA mismatch endonuclease Vsr [Rhizobium lentis]|uniref:DNA mismatch endonuclease Vsr n=1 Tax=Rhizobium lentis TaxID=1138194 RepID=UPI001C83B4E3|nr:DNA mismatch endonuclease Vsr [Rhizobium lentis]MBX4997461.1 DNA mismatch endonuclease Vsr [Rhizobium lentis]
MDLEATPTVRRRMQRTRGRDNPFEVLIRSQLYAKGIRYRAHYSVPGMKRITCDIAVPKLRIAVFLDGCFWHGCDIHPPSVKKNTAFWMEKIERNRARDRRVREHLAEIGWTTFRFWEHEAAETIVRRIVSTVEEYRAAKPSPCSSARSLQDVKRPP